MPKSQKDRRAPNRVAPPPAEQDPQGGRSGKKQGGRGGAGAQSGATGHQGKVSPR